MPYQCDLGGGHHLYLANQGGDTVVTSAMGGPGQQQQSSHQFRTGPWTAPPQVQRVAGGVVVEVFTAEGPRYLQVQGQQVGMTAQSNWGGAEVLGMTAVDAMPSGPTMQPMQPMQPMEPMQPMQPMQMGDMSMSLNPMEMRMGNLEMRMGSNPDAQPAQRRFCTQCGAPVQPKDRFCGQCGHSLQ